MSASLPKRFETFDKGKACRNYIVFIKKKTRNHLNLIMCDSGTKEFFGSVLLSHSASRAVPSAQKSLTSVFGMGTGVASLL